MNTLILPKAHPSHGKQIAGASAAARLGKAVITTAFILISLQPQLSAQPAAAEKLSKLSQSYEAASERALAPLRQTYLAELAKLKTEYTKAGDLDSALAVDAVMKQLNPTAPATLTPAATTASKSASEPAEVKKAAPGNPRDLLPPAPKDLREREILKIVEGKVWRLGTELLRLDAEGKGARFTSYAGVEPNLKWKLDPQTRIITIFSGYTKLVRIMSETSGVAVFYDKPEAGVMNFMLENKPVPELAPTSLK
jgi:hypothetical protein